MSTNPFPFVTPGFVTAMLMGFAIGVAVDVNGSWGNVVRVVVIVLVGMRALAFTPRALAARRRRRSFDQSGFRRFLWWYEAYGTPTQWVRWFQGREEYFVALRIALLVAIGYWGLHPWQGWSASSIPLYVVGAWLTLDAILITTAHAFLPFTQSKTIPRFVGLNVAVFATLPLAFAVLVAPFTGGFNDSMDYRRTLELGLSATMFAEGLTAPKTADSVATAVVYVGNVIGMFFVAVILVSAVDRLTQLREAARAVEAKPQVEGSDTERKPA